MYTRDDDAKNIMHDSLFLQRETERFRVDMRFIHILFIMCVNSRCMAAQMDISLAGRNFNSGGLMDSRTRGFRLFWGGEERGREEKRRGEEEKYFLAVLCGLNGNLSGSIYIYIS